MLGRARREKAHRTIQWAKRRALSVGTTATGGVLSVASNRMKANAWFPLTMLCYRKGSALVAQASGRINQADNLFKVQAHVRKRVLKFEQGYQPASVHLDFVHCVIVSNDKVYLIHGFPLNENF